MKLEPEAPLAPDPYLDWALATQWRGLVPEGSGLRVPLLVRRAPAQSWAALAAQLPPGARLGARTPAAAMLGTVWVEPEQAQAVQALVQATQLSQPVPAAWPRQPAALRGRQQPAVPVIVGVVDRGGAFLNRAFRTPAGASRLLAYWDQSTLAGEDPQASPWRLPAEGFGRMLDRTTLQALCRRARSLQQERQIYAELGLHELLDSAADEAPDHASHVLDTLAGPPSAWPAVHSAKPVQPDAAAQAPLVLVSVPSVRPDQSTGAPAVAQVLEALHFILAQAAALNPAAAVVVNLSLGMQAGPHDGSLLIEQAFDELMLLYPQLLLVLPAGNRWREPLNAGGGLAVGQGASVAWRLQPRDPTDSFLELWWRGSAAAVQALRVRLRSPSGELSEPLRPGQSATLRDAEQRCLARLSLQAPELQAGPPAHWRCRGLLALAPTQAGRRGAVPAGAWRLEFERLPAAGEQGEPLRLSLWVQGDQPVIARGDVVQSHLEAAQGLKLEADGALNALASGRFPIVVGASQWLEGQAAGYSAELVPVLAQAKQATQAVQLLAVADASAAEPGLLAAGVLSGQWARMNGTSVAAPVVARHWVNWLWQQGLAGLPAPAQGQPLAARWRLVLQRVGAPKRRGAAAALPRPQASAPLRRLDLRPGPLPPWLR